MVVALQAVAAAGRAADRANVNDIRISGIHGDITAFARADDVAVFPGDRRIAAAAGHAQAGVVLLRAINVIGLVAIDIDVIKLRRRLVVNARPGQPAIQRDAGAAVVAVDHDLVVARMYPEIVIIAMRRGDLAEVVPAIGRFPKTEVVDVNRIRVSRVSGQVHVIPGARDEAVVLAADHPGLAIIITAVDAAIGLILDDRPNTSRLRGRCRQANLAQHSLGQSLSPLPLDGGGAGGGGEPLPTVAAIHRAPDAAIRAAGGDIPEVAISLPEGGIDDARVVLVDRQVDGARFFADV